MDNNKPKIEYKEIVIMYNFNSEKKNNSDEHEVIENDKNNRYILSM